jgi:hypothetical protein
MRKVFPASLPGMPGLPGPRKFLSAPIALHHLGIRSNDEKPQRKEISKIMTNQMKASENNGTG